MKKQLYRIVTGILAVAWMCLIFSFSNQPATESSKVSGGLCHRLVERANDTLHLDMTEKQQLTMAEKIEYPVRKAGHHDIESPPEPLRPLYGQPTQCHLQSSHPRRSRAVH